MKENIYFVDLYFFKLCELYLHKTRGQDTLGVRYPCNFPTVK